MIGFALAPVDDAAINRGKDRATEADESSGRRCAGDGSPGTGVRGSTAKIHAAEVDRVPFAQYVRSVAGHPPRRAVLDQPPVGERQRGSDPTGGRGAQRTDPIFSVHTTYPAAVGWKASDPVR
jgi:hypothetical protein